MIYQYNLFGLNTSSVVFNVPSLVSTTCCCYVKRFYPLVLADFSALIISVSSRKVKSAITSANRERHDTTSSPTPWSRIIANEIILIITNIVVHVPLPCLLPCRGGYVEDYFVIDNPNAVLISCVADCNVFIIEHTNS